MSTSPKPKPKRRYYTTPEGKRRMVRCGCNSNGRARFVAADNGFNAIHIDEVFNYKCPTCGFHFYYIDGKLEASSE